MSCYSSKIWGNTTRPCLEMLLIYHVPRLLGHVCWSCKDLSRPCFHERDGSIRERCWKGCAWWHSHTPVISPVELELFPASLTLSPMEGRWAAAVVGDGAMLLKDFCFSCTSFLGPLPPNFLNHQGWWGQWRKCGHRLFWGDWVS